MTEERHVQIDAETLAGRRFPYQEDISLVRGVDLLDSDAGARTSTGSRMSNCSRRRACRRCLSRYSNSFLLHPLPDPGRARERDRPQPAGNRRCGYPGRIPTASS